MPKTRTSEAILYAIHAAIRLGPSIQRAYVNSIKAKQIVLPLPAFDATPTLLSASRFFENENEGKIFLEDLKSLKKLHEARTIRSLTPDEVNAYLEYYVILFRALRKEETGSSNIDEASIQTKDILALLQVRQWERGESPHPSALQLVASNLVEIGIDYFNYIPGALNPASTGGKVLKSVMDGFDRIQVSEAEHIKQTISQEVVPILFLGATETLSELSPKISADPKVQQFIAQSAESISGDLIARLQGESDTKRRSEAIQWGQFVLNSLIRNAGTLIVNSPASVVTSEEKIYRVIEASGQALLDMVLAEGEEGIRLKELLRTDALDQIMRSTLELIAEVPQLWTNKEGLQSIIKDLSRALVKSDIQQPSLLPHLLHLVLSSTAAHIHKLWQSDVQEAPNLLVEGTSQILHILAKKRYDKHWQARLAQNEVLILIEDLLQHLVQHPIFLMKKLEQNTIFYTTIDITINSLAGIPQNERLSLSSLQRVLDQVLYTILAHPHLLQKINFLDDATEQFILQQFLDLILKKVSKEEEPEGFNQRLHDWVPFFLERLLVPYPDRRSLMILEFLDSELCPINYSQTDRKEAVGLIIDLLLDLLEQHANLFAESISLERIQEDLLKALEVLIPHPNLLLGVVAMILEKSIDRLDQLLDGETNAPKLQHLLIDIAAQTCDVLSDEAYPKLGLNQFSREQSEGLFEYLLEEVMEIPGWAEPDRIRGLLHGVFVAIQSQVDPINISFVVCMNSIKTFMEEMNSHAIWFQALILESGKEILPVTYCLEWIFQLIYTQPFGMRMHLLKEKAFSSMLTYCIDLNQRRGISIVNMDDTALRLNEQINELAAGLLSMDNFIKNLS